MESNALAMFKKALETPSPSGYESPIQELVRQYVGRFADEVRTDVHGNVIAIKNPDAPVRIMLAGHCDQIGLIVQYIDSDGFIYVQQIGGWDPQVLIGQKMNIWTAGGPIFGVIARKPIHLLTDEEKKNVVKLNDLWIDIGAADKEEAEKLVRVGDPITVDLGAREMCNNHIASPGM
ncbi:MAG: M42 family peptidase, partial [Planctomycetota bacterium]|nr:M42 family peptidase [Planctomycetota bacterium]